MKRRGSLCDLCVYRGVGRLENYALRTSLAAQRSADLTAPRTCDVKRSWYCSAAIRAEKSLTAWLGTAVILYRKPAEVRPDTGKAADAEA